MRLRDREYAHDALRDNRTPHLDTLHRCGAVRGDVSRAGEPSCRMESRGVDEGARQLSQRRPCESSSVWIARCHHPVDLGPHEDPDTASVAQEEQQDPRRVVDFQGQSLRSPFTTLC